MIWPHDRLRLRAYLLPLAAFGDHPPQGYVSSSPGLGSILLPWRADLVGLVGTDILAPGAVTALIDHTCGLAIMAHFGTRAAPATLDL